MKIVSNKKSPLCSSLSFFCVIFVVLQCDLLWIFKLPTHQTDHTNIKYKRTSEFNKCTQSKCINKQKNDDNDDDDNNNNQTQAFNNNTRNTKRNPEIQTQNPNTPNSVAPLPSVSNRFGPDDDDDSPIQSVAIFILFCDLFIFSLVVSQNTSENYLVNKTKKTPKFH